MCAPKYFSNLDLKLKNFDTVALELFVGLIIHVDGWSRQLVHTYHDYSCCLHIKPFFLPNISSTPSVLPDSSLGEIQILLSQTAVRQRKTKR